MKNKSSNNGLLLLIAICILIVLLGAIYFFTRNEGVKDCQDEFKDKAQKLKQQIIEKENAISALILEIQSLKAYDKFLIDQAVEIYKAAKLFVILIIASACLIAYALWNFNLFQCLCAIGPLILVGYYTITFYFQNKAGDINKTLKLIQNYFINRQYRKYCFEPAYIYTLEKKLEDEQKELEKLKLVYLELKP